MKFIKMIRNKKGASMMDYFIISAVSILIGGAIFIMGSKVYSGIKIGTESIDNINSTLRGKEDNAGK